MSNRLHIGHNNYGEGEERGQGGGREEDSCREGEEDREGEGGGMECRTRYVHVGHNNYGEGEESTINYVYVGQNCIERELTTHNTS